MVRMRRRPSPSAFDSLALAVELVASEDDRAAGAICRICFEAGDGLLIAPCKCTGSQKWVHVECVRRWQRSCTEPRAAHYCSVCTSPFDLPPPEGVMPLIEPGCLLVASPNVQGPYARAVVLICAAEGPSAQGLVLNQPFGDDDSMAPREVRRRIRSCRLVEKARALRSSGSAASAADTDESAAASSGPLPVAFQMASVQAEAEELLAQARALERPCQHNKEEDDAQFSLRDFLAAASDGPWPLRTECRHGGPSCSGTDEPVRISALHTVPETPGQAVASTPFRVAMQGGRLAAWSEAELPGHLAQLAAAAQQHACTARLILFLGSAHWSRQSLEDEVAQGRWGVCAARAVDFLAHTPLDQLWDAARLRCHGATRRGGGGTLRASTGAAA